ncbi:phospholipase D family protein [Seongchinamella unica]|uniref:Phospholipase D family protein n=1 Tax=Seongchinamella unica TaxID=2547392 RepID=A0A4R5LVD4_9GAMM|nr:phospholipase D family protein [Seongchinamella unica]TDG15404.1 phospholipase D family protein [Seongchinamella unica]
MIDRPTHRSLLRNALLATCMSLLAACASVPFDYPRDTSLAIPAVPDSEIGAVALAWQREHGEQSGFLGLSDGVDALGARLRLLELARESVDAQYFILKKDQAGALFAAGLLAAADRGVRVRLLVDDIFSPGVDAAFTLMATHPNIEVRLFNPLARQRLKYLGFLTDFKRANRRMHNKSFTVDGGISIVGGRNIGEEYFEINQDVKFDDYEVLAIGEIVQEIQGGFDKFWNSDLSVPIEAFGVEVDPAVLDEWRVGLREQIEGQRNGIYATALDSRLLRDIKEGVVKPVVAQADLYTDAPDKLQAAVGDDETAVLANELGRRLRASEREVVIVTPYFIPQDSGARLVETLLARGVRVVIVTNSLASTNHIPVHAGYARYRKRLLRAGAEFFEIRADAVGDKNNAWGHRPETMTLHSKASVVDRETVFIGSLNFDPRSIYINTEMGLFIESADVGDAFTREIFQTLSKVTWQVELDERGALRWVFDDGEQREVVDTEPGAGAWRKLQVAFYRLLPIESQL